MKREYHRWFSPSLGREMELLIYGHGGVPSVVFPTSQGRFYEFEDNGMVEAVREKVERGEHQFFCVDSVDGESWYNAQVPPRWRIARQLQYEGYVMGEVVPLMNALNSARDLGAIGCSFGGYHAANLAFRHPGVFRAMLSMAGAFHPAGFLGGYYDQDCYFNLPMDYMQQISDPWYMEQYRRNIYIFATGVHDQCWNANERMAELLRSKGVPCRLDVWGDNARHDWPWWRRMMQTYL